MLSICIVNWNTRDYLSACLESIEAYPPADEACETIVVDNASIDGSVEMLRARFPSVVLIANAHNAGYAGGNNQALAAATGDRLLLLNPDVVLEAATLTRALEFLDTHPDAGLVGARQIQPDGATQHSVRGFPAPAAITWEVLGLGRLFPRSRRFASYMMRGFDYDRATEVDQPMGTFLLARREVYDAIGGMDESFPIFFNEVDWCYRAKQAGWKIYYTPDARLVHYGGGSTRQAPKPAMIRESHRSMIRFFDKHYRKTMSPLAYRLAVEAILAGEAIRIARAQLLGRKREP
ncbi:MAG: glycosyltransferase family 2 protein [Capsulimonadaceae bacterium]|nr:glycosyltransferase family 2 protein [Capsulimonadaceae bacterium]